MKQINDPTTGEPIAFRLTFAELNILGIESCKDDNEQATDVLASIAAKSFIGGMCDVIIANPDADPETLRAVFLAEGIDPEQSTPANINIRDFN